MKEIVIALLSGGAIVQVANMLATLRQNRRQLNASALGTEVAALEKTICVLQSNFENENRRHREEITELRTEVKTLQGENMRLRTELSFLRRRGGAYQLKIPML